MTGNADVVIDEMSVDDLATAMDWASVEGWNPGLADARSFHAADPSGFLAARLDGRMVGSVSAVKSGADFGFIGMFIVVPELRGAGIGMRLWDAGMARLAGRVVGLDGVVEMQDAYSRSGFALDHRNLRYSGSLAEVPGSASDVIALGPRDLDAVAAYDSPCFGSDRREFLTAWLAQPNAFTCGVVRESLLAGYGTIRQAREGWKVGPLFADDIDA
ncbi:MAG: GNAT family N-acetyltransferase, partial [bacterium]|nr:GNAT family N-acetyltransferase [bacterium]